MQTSIVENCDQTASVVVGAFVRAVSLFTNLAIILDFAISRGLGLRLLNLSTEISVQPTTKHGRIRLGNLL
jgi:hypothetical protein